MSNPYPEGARVRWRDGGTWTFGRVVESHPSRPARQRTKREKSPCSENEELAYLIEQEIGGSVLKQHGEIERAE